MDYTYHEVKKGTNQMFSYCIMFVFSSPEPLGSQGELIGWPRLGVRSLSIIVRPSATISKIIFSKTAWPIKAKFYRKHLWEGGINLFINNPGHMIKMATMPIYGKNPLKFFTRTTGPISTKLGMKHWGLEYYKLFINHDLWMTLTYFTTRST